MEQSALIQFHLDCKQELNTLFDHFNILFYGYGCKKDLLHALFPSVAVVNCWYCSVNDVVAELKTVFENEVKMSQITNVDENYGSAINVKDNLIVEKETSIKNIINNDWNDELKIKSNSFGNTENPIHNQVREDVLIENDENINETKKPIKKRGRKKKILEPISDKVVKKSIQCISNVKQNPTINYVIEEKNEENKKIHQVYEKEHKESSTSSSGDISKDQNKITQFNDLETYTTIGKYFDELDKMLIKKKKGVKVILLNFNLKLDFLKNKKNIRFIATMERLGTPLQQNHLHEYNLVMRDLTTFVPYTYETMDIEIKKGDKSKTVINILNNVSKKIKKILTALIFEFMQKEEFSASEMMDVI
ncbi:hypothetical protein COBT_002045, partial [Conglomerata obtusa]